MIFAFQVISKLRIDGLNLHLLYQFSEILARFYGQFSGLSCQFSGLSTATASPFSCQLSVLSHILGAVTRKAYAIN